MWMRILREREGFSFTIGFKTLKGKVATKMETHNGTPHPTNVCCEEEDKEDEDKERSMTFYATTRKTSSSSEFDACEKEGKRAVMTMMKEKKQNWRTIQEGILPRLLALSRTREDLNKCKMLAMSSVTFNTTIDDSEEETQKEEEEAFRKRLMKQICVALDATTRRGCEVFVRGGKIHRQTSKGGKVLVLLESRGNFEVREGQSGFRPR